MRQNDAPSSPFRLSSVNDVNLLFLTASRHYLSNKIHINTRRKAQCTFWMNKKNGMKPHSHGYIYIYEMPTIHVTNMEINNVNDKQENNLKKSIYQTTRRRRRKHPP